VIYKGLERDARGQLKVAQASPNMRYHREAAKVIRALLEKGSISDKEYNNLVGPTVGRKLLEKNVFSFHTNDSKVVFQSVEVARYCKQNSNFWEKRFLFF